MSETGDSHDNGASEMAVQALACDDPDLNAIRDQMAKADPELRVVLENYLASWFQYNHNSPIVG